MAIIPYVRKTQKKQQQQKNTHTNFDNLMLIYTVKS